MNITELITEEESIQNYMFSANLNKLLYISEYLSLIFPKIILYGAGNVSKLITSCIPDNIVSIVDQNSNLKNKKIGQVYVQEPLSILKLEYDIVIVTVLGRENDICNFLKNNLKVNSNKIYFFNLNVKYENNLKILDYRMHQKNMNMKVKHDLFPYQIDESLKVLNLVFFMGVGDYLYVTPVIDCLKKKYKYIEINAFVSKNFDVYNSPLVYDLLRKNPHINKIEYYNGLGNKKGWEFYDFSDVKRFVGDEIVFPVLCEDINKKMKHRVFEMYRVFSTEIDTDKSVPLPLLYIEEEDYIKSKNLVEYIEHLGKEIVILHFESRSTDNIYDEHELEIIAKELIEKNYFVICIGQLSNTKLFNEKEFYSLRIKEFTLSQSMAFLNAIKSKKYFIALNSVMFPISSALGIPMLALYIFKNSLQTRQTFYENMHVVTIDRECYEFLPEKNCTLIDEKNVNVIDDNLVKYPIKLILKEFLTFKESYN